MKHRRVALEFALAAALACAFFCGCDLLPDINADGRCGNGVVEPASGEDCDTYAPAGEKCGALSTASACLYECGSGAGDPACPSGFHCGLDGICRASAGRFNAPVALAVGAGQVHLGDINGDRHTDFVVVEDDGVGVYLGGLSGGFIRTAGTPADVGQVSLELGQLSGGAETDAALLINGGLLHALGGAAGELLPVVYPSLTSQWPDAMFALVPVRAVAPYQSDSVVMISTDAANHLVALVKDAASTDDSALTALGPAVSFMVSTRGGDIDRAAPNAPRTSDEFIVVIAGTPSAYVFSVDCAAANGACTIRPRGSIGIAGGVMQTYWADLDGDGNLDAIFQLQPMQALQFATVTMVAYGDGSGGFGGPNGSGGPAMARPLVASSLTCPACPAGYATVLAVADFDADGRPDIVSSAGIFFVRSLDPWTADAGPAPTSTPWIEAVTADFNRDGLVDVALAAGGNAGVDLLVGTRPGLFDHLFVNTIGAQTHNLAVGDFDGDQAPDLAFATGMQEAHVLYSDAQGLPRLNTLEGDRDGIEPMHALERASGLPADLVLSARYGVTGGATVRQVYSLHSDGGQLMRSSIGLEGKTAEHVTLGRFGARADEQADTLLLMSNASSPATREVWLLETANPIGGTVPQPTQQIAAGAESGDICNAFVQTNAPAIAAADLDGDHRDEVMAVDLNPSGMTPPNTYAHFEAMWAEVAGGHVTCHSLTALTGAFYPGAMEVADVDGDGHLDMLVTLHSIPPMLGQMPSTPSPNTPAEGFAIYFGQDDPNARFASKPDYYTIQPDVQAAIVVAGRIAVVAATDAWLLSLQPDRTLPARSEWPALPVGTFGPGTQSLLVADIDGDGLDDLVLAGDTTAVMLQQTCSAGEAAAGKCTQEGN